MVRHVYDDSWQCLADIDGNGNVLRPYVWGEGIDKLLAVKIGGESYYPLTDIQGTVWGYVDSQNNIVARWTYDAWGNGLSENGRTYKEQLDKELDETQYLDTPFGIIPNPCYKGPLML